MQTSFTIKIDFNGYVTFSDLDTIISQADYLLESHLRNLLNLSPIQKKQSKGNFFQIGKISEGSILITGTAILGGAIAGLVAGSFKKGFEKSIFGKQIEKVAEKIGDTIGALVDKINKKFSSLAKSKSKFGRVITGIKLTINTEELDEQIKEIRGRRAYEAAQRGLEMPISVKRIKLKPKK
jgi:hypothetical protein